MRRAQSLVYTDPEHDCAVYFAGNKKTGHNVKSFQVVVVRWKQWLYALFYDISRIIITIIIGVDIWTQIVIGPYAPLNQSQLSACSV